MTDNPERSRTEARNEAASILTEFASFSRLTKKAPLLDTGTSTATTDSTCTTSTNESAVVSSSASSRVDPYNMLIKRTVAKKLLGKNDADKRRKISLKGRSIKFPVRLMFLLEECKEYESIISWAADGLSFVIHDIQQLEEQVLRKRFKDTKYGSFLRKLYRWGFMKRALHGKKISYINKKFQRGNYSLCMEMGCTSQSWVEAASKIQSNTNSGHLQEVMRTTRADQGKEAQSATPDYDDTSPYCERSQIRMRQHNLERQQLERQILERQELDLFRQQLQEEQQQQMSDAHLNEFMSDALSVANTNDNFNSDMMPPLYSTNTACQFNYSTPPGPLPQSWTMKENLQLWQQNQPQQQYPENSNYFIKSNDIVQNTHSFPMYSNSANAPIDSYHSGPTMTTMYYNHLNAFVPISEENQDQCEYPDRLEYGFESPQQQLSPMSKSLPEVNPPSSQQKKVSSDKDFNADPLIDIAISPLTTGTDMVRRGGTYY